MKIDANLSYANTKNFLTGKNEKIGKQKLKKLAQVDQYARNAKHILVYQ